MEPSLGIVKLREGSLTTLSMTQDTVTAWSQHSHSHCHSTPPSLKLAPRLAVTSTLSTAAAPKTLLKHSDLEKSEEF